ncbi:Coiled-coil domain-containing protein 48 [Chaetura pelagica]|nr:Coiled-coil domain-containing protein 48 [Chaetura pelagica]
MEPGEGWAPYGRPARRTQWLVSALAYHYGLDRGVENEIVVLATGLDQYLQEIFHHLDCSGEGKIPEEDFRTLCQVLELEEKEEPEECAGLWQGRTPEVCFPQSTAVRAGAGSAEGLRRGLLAPLQSPSPSGAAFCPCSAASSETRRHFTAGLRKSHAKHKEEGTCFLGSKRQLAPNHSQPKCLQSVMKEVELLRSSRDGQIEEAIRFNQELERELKSSQEALVNLEDCNRNLKREQAEMRKKVEEARHAVLSSLGKVKELEVKATQVPHLHTYIQQLESELQRWR